MLARSHASVGSVTLNRPRALNAINIEMIRLAAAALERFRTDTDIDVVVLDGAGDRGLCAGGDVRSLHDSIRSGNLEAVGEYFRAEYALNAQIATFPKPVVSFAEGITMGGGVGFASHAAIRLVTEHSQLAMPEVRIGLTPDVGGSFLLSRAPGRVGEYLALTASVMDASDAMYAGFADYFVRSEHLADVREALITRADPNTPTELILLFDETPETSRLERARPWIDDAFAADTVTGILTRLDARPESDATDAAEAIRAMSPTSVTITLAAVRAARALPDLAAVLAQEYTLMMWAATQPDAAEGIRAQLVDKDRSPVWTPPQLSEVAAGTAERALAYVPPVPFA